MNSLLKYIILSVAIAAVSACSSEYDGPTGGNTESPGVTLRLTTGGMLPQIVASRADAPEQKAAAERRINTVHLFFFDADGNFMIPTDAEAFAPYRRYDFTGGAQPYINIPGDAFENQQSLTGVQIYAAVNIEGTAFRTEWTPDGDIVAGDASDPSKEIAITKLDDLLAWVYRPSVRDDVSKLPEAGMPMVGRLVRTQSLSGTDDIDLRLTALMARVDATVKLDASQENHEALLPALTVSEFGVINMPATVPFFPGEGYHTECEGDDLIDERTVKIAAPETIYDGGESTLFTYYTYENIREAADNGFSFPEGVNPDDDAVTQRWKPRRAPEGASALVIRGHYATHQDLDYQAQFMFYLGSNTTDNFEVYRNRRYINNVTISGLEYVRNSDENVFTFDARVNVTTDNPVYISMVNERRLDAHWCVIPMDVYFLESAPQGATCEIELSDDAAQWVSLEYCDASAVSEQDIKAGWGCRPYFTTDMLTSVVTAKQAVARNNRDRIYFYVDENASVKSRTGVINLRYRSSETAEPVERTIELEQAGLLPFTVDGQTFYMESYEEYAEHYDPLDLHSPSPWYQPDGIPWAAPGSKLAEYEIGTSSYRLWPPGVDWKPFDTTDAEGLLMSNYLFNYQTYSSRSISGVEPISDRKIYSEKEVASAVQYAAANNKREADGSVSELKWFLPGIGQLEAMMKSYTFQQFKSNYYWSASVAKNPNNSASISEGRENKFRARATKLTNSNQTVESGDKGQTAASNNNVDYASSQDYPDGGRTLRTQKLRVRAIRTADGVATN